MRNSRKRSLIWLINTLEKLAPLNQPRLIEKAIELKTGNNNYRNTFLKAYQRYLSFFGLSVKLNYYPESNKEIRCPTREKLQMIIANSSNPKYVIEILSRPSINKLERLAKKYGEIEETGIKTILVSDFKDGEDYLDYAESFWDFAIDLKELEKLKEIIRD